MRFEKTNVNRYTKPNPTLLQCNIDKILSKVHNNKNRINASALHPYELNKIVKVNNISKKSLINSVQ
jgi:hypothetical protein